MTDDKARVEALRSHGWRQGSVLPSFIVEKAKLSRRWPPQIAVGSDDWLILLSHNCDLRNRNPANEPDVEVLVARPLAQNKANSRETHGRNSRRLQFRGRIDGTEVGLVAHAHERFVIDRLSLAERPPEGERTVERLDILIAWIAKRYQRQAFPDEFDQLAIKAKPKVDKFLEKYAGQILGIFIAFDDREEQEPRFHLEFRIVIKRNAVEEEWAVQKADLEEAFESCWEGVQDMEVEASAVQDRNFSIGEMSEGRFKKFDRDWISYATDPEGEAGPEV